MIFVSILMYFVNFLICCLTNRNISKFTFNFVFVIRVNAIQFTSINSRRRDDENVFEFFTSFISTFFEFRVRQRETRKTIKNKKKKC